MGKQRRKGVYSVELDEDAVLAMAKEIVARRFQPGPTMTSAKEAKEYLVVALASEEREHFGMLYLDNSHKLLGYDVLFHGTIDGAAVYSRDVVKSALRYNAAAVIVAHNHPSGNPEPSRSDIRLTEQLRVALDTVDIRLLDHVIVAGAEVVSLAEKGLMPGPYN